MRPRSSKAFTLVEILIVVVILGILAAIVIPQFTNASEDAQTGNVVTQLQSIRQQIELFRIRHNSYTPSLVGVQGGSFTDLLYPPNATETYIRSAPLNPRNRRSDVVEDATPLATAAASPTPAAGPGWYFNSTTGDFAAAGFDEQTGRWVP